MSEDVIFLFALPAAMVLAVAAFTSWLQWRDTKRYDESRAKQPGAAE
jgi:hypothetical protein